MHKKISMALFLASLSTTSAVHAAPELIAIGTINGAYEDFALRTSGALENKIPGNRLGGIGSGLAYAGGNTFIALPDRGPNANEYNASVDDTVSYINRFHTLSLTLAKSDEDSALPFTLTPMLIETTLLSSKTPLYYSSGTAYGLASGIPALNQKKRTYYFTGRSDNFDSNKGSLNSKNARLDTEGVRVSNDGRTIFISDEYGPYVYGFDRETGVRTKVFTLPATFAASNLSAVGDDEISGNTSGRVANKGMEGLAITPDGETLVGAMQSPLLQDGGTGAAVTRIVTIDIKTGATKEYAYQLDNIGSESKPKYSSVSEILAINNHEFLVDERDGKGLSDDSKAVQKKLYKIDLEGATDISGLSGTENLQAKAVGKILFLDLVAALNDNGIAATAIPAKLEGIAFGQDIEVDGVSKHTLYVSNDNDYLATTTLGSDTVENPNTFYVFSFTDEELPEFVPQCIRPYYQEDVDGNNWVCDRERGKKR